MGEVTDGQNCNVEITLTDKYMVDNGYFFINIDKSGAFGYPIYMATEKWRKLFDTCILIAKKNNSIVTEAIIINAIKGGNTKRADNRLSPIYKKKKRPEGYMTVKERNEFKLKERERLGLKKCKPDMKYDNRQFK